MRALAIVVSILASGCGHSETRRTTGDAPEIFSEAVRAAVARPNDAMTTRRAALSLDSGLIVYTCADYLKARRAGAAVAESAGARLASSEYAVCDTLDAVRCSTRGVGGRHANVGDDLASRLDLRQVRSSLGPRLDDRIHTLAALGEPLHASDTEVSLATDDWTFILRIVAVADVDGDGRSDWVLWMTDEARSGSYREYATLVVLDPDKPGPLRALPWPPPGGGRGCPQLKSAL